MLDHLGIQCADMTASAAFYDAALAPLGSFVRTDDAAAAHATLTALGLSVGDLLDWPTAPLMFTFCDLDGNRLYVAEPS